MEIMFAASRFNRTSVAHPVERNSGMDCGDLANPTASVAVADQIRATAPRHRRSASNFADAIACREVSGSHRTAGPPSCKIKAVLSRAMCENACGKFPTRDGAAYPRVIRRKGARGCPHAHVPTAFARPSGGSISSRNLTVQRASDLRSTVKAPLSLCANAATKQSPDDRPSACSMSNPGPWSRT
jgi:hypothetical protein